MVSWPVFPFSAFHRSFLARIGGGVRQGRAGGESRRLPIYRPMFESDGPKGVESTIILFSFEIGHTRRTDRPFEHQWRPFGVSLAFCESWCDKGVIGEPPNLIQTVAPGWAGIGRLITLSETRQDLRGPLGRKTRYA
jgi:hypothetical protein